MLKSYKLYIITILVLVSIALLVVFIKELMKNNDYAYTDDINQNRAVEYRDAGFIIKKVDSNLIIYKCVTAGDSIIEQFYDYAYVNKDLIDKNTLLKFEEGLYFENESDLYDFLQSCSS